MNAVDHLVLKKRLIEWRDHQCQAIEDHLQHSFVLLWDEVEQQVDEMTLVDIMQGKKFAATRIAPIWERWVTNESTVLLAKAQRELATVIEVEIARQDVRTPAPDPGRETIFKDGAVVATATAGAGVAVVTLLPATVTTVSAGGILGFLGVTTAVIAWPVVIGLVAVVGTALAIGGTKALGARDRAVRNYKKQLRKWLETSAIDSGNPTSLVLTLQREIRRVAGASLHHLEQQP